MGSLSLPQTLLQRAAIVNRRWPCVRKACSFRARLGFVHGKEFNMEPISHFFYSDRLKLQFWDYGQDAKPSLVLVHGALDHARNWDWVARSLREQYHVYALDLRGHGNSAWAPGATYSVI